MRHEKIFTRDDASRVKIDVQFYIDHRDAKWIYHVSLCQKGKSKFDYPVSDDDYEYRKIPFEDRRPYLESNYLKHVSLAEILQTKLELWEKIKPT